MSTETEKKVRILKAAIEREANPLRKSNLRFQLQGLVKVLAAREFQEKVRLLSGNGY
ncbi:hypothetical protein [Rhizobium azibense]|uniref:Uncharacterized protein n=1 Tax=Rhizobium azibense TaxID=1136135 RepID=A0A4R3RKF0_9HYPH|nr:hypothetical protein [Rhizobium azibense]TCU34102.1 hypothetical protein EV129_11385 [Rhizobium azibense]